MRLSQLCIDRPVLATVLSLVLVVFGILGFNYLTVRYEPKVFEPHLDVSVGYPGASAALMEQQVTDKLEGALAGLSDVETMTSFSTQGSTDIELNFGNISEAEFVDDQAEAERLVSSVSGLPEAASQPEVSGHDNENFIAAYGFYDPSYTDLEMTDFINQNVVTQLNRVPGVGGVNVNGGTPVLRIAVNPQKLALYGLTINDLVQALENNNASFSAGSIVNQDQVITINAQSPLASVQSFEDLVVANHNGQLIRIKNVATVSMGDQEIDPSQQFINGHPGVVIQVYAGEDSNPIDVGKALNDTLVTLKSTLPPGMHVVNAFDLTSQLKQSVIEVAKTVIEAIILVSLIVLCFLGRFRSATIPIVTIPVCLIAAFGFMYVLGFSINIVSMMAIVLAVGLVVDDAIVVLENTHRHIEKGLAPLDAAKTSMSEISFAVIGMTVCLLAVYFPTAFMSGKAAVNFQEFAFTLAAAVLVSGFVALTLTPMMCGRLLVARTNLSRYEQWLEIFYSKMRSGYQWLLERAMRLRWGVIVIFILLVILGRMLLVTIPSAMFPKDNLNAVLYSLRYPVTSNVNYSVPRVKAFNAKVAKLPNVNFLASWIDANETMNWVTLPQNASDYQINTLAKTINNMIAQTPGVNGGAMVPDLNGNTNSEGDFQMYVLGNISYPQLASVTQQYLEALQKYPGLNNAHTNLKFDNLQYNLSINAKLASSLDVPLSNIDTTLNALFGGPILNTYYNVNNASYPIVVQLPRNEITDFSVLQNIYVKNQEGQSIPLSQLVSAKPILDLSERIHYNQMRAAEIDANLTQGYTLGQVVSYAQRLANTSLPKGVAIGFTGDAERLLKNHKALGLIFIMGIIFIYLVLAALFESFIDPFIILLTVPMCIVGALAALKFTGASLNIFTGIGLLTLVGLVSKHGILITQFANRLIERGNTVHDAIVKAATIRLRPIIMTTTTMVLGALPLVISTGPGHSSRNQIGWVIVAGLLVGTFFSLFVVPVAYSLLARLRRKTKSDVKFI